MSLYRKKPVVIEAEQWFPDGPTVKGVHWEKRAGDDGEFLHPYVITVHEQRAYLAPGDWVMPEPVEGRFYPCKPDIFEATYEPAALTNPMPAEEREAEPFGYWIEQKYAEPALLRKPAYIPEPSELRTVTPLYTADQIIALRQSPVRAEDEA